MSVEVSQEWQAELARKLLAERFEALSDPLGWRCLGCNVTVVADVDGPDVTPASVNRLAESAADHSIYCGRCED